MGLPSVKTLLQLFPETDSQRQDKAKQVRAILENANMINEFETMERVDKIIGTYGVETTPEGHNAKSPAIIYCNTGDTYGTTLLLVNGHFYVGNWGTRVEHGNYD